MGYDYEILYHPSKENLAADTLSRVADSPILHALSKPQVQIWDEIKTISGDHPFMQRVCQLAKSNPCAPYIWCDGLVFYKNRVVVPSNSFVVSNLMQEFNDSQIGGHSGVLKTYKRIAQQFYWPSPYKIVNEYVAACDICQKSKVETLFLVGLLQPLPIPCQVWEDITLDFIEGLPTSHGKDTIR